MGPKPLAATFLVVMAAAAGCFVAAFLRRRERRLHIRLALTGAALDIVGTIAVLVTARVLEWHVPPRFPTVAAIHRAFAYAATALLLTQAATGFARSRGLQPFARFHGPLAGLFLPVYLVTYGLAVAAYGWWW